MLPTIILGSVFGFVTLFALACAGIAIGPFLRKTFMPMTKRDFWFPPCPFCWGARAAAVALIATVIVSPPWA